MGDAATSVQRELADALRRECPRYDWSTEYDVGGTPVDVGGVDDDGTSGPVLALCELEWRRADPADNTAKLFRHLAGGILGRFETVRIAQVFTGYYVLAGGGHSAKRLNAEFVGGRVAATFDHVDYRPVTLALDPPKRGTPLPDGWRDAVASLATDLGSMYAGCDPR